MVYLFGIIFRLTLIVILITACNSVKEPDGACTFCLYRGKNATLLREGNLIVLTGIGVRKERICVPVSFYRDSFRGSSIYPHRSIRIKGTINNERITFNLIILPVGEELSGATLFSLTDTVRRERYFKGRPHLSLQEKLERHLESLLILCGCKPAG